MEYEDEYKPEIQFNSLLQQLKFTLLDSCATDSYCVTNIACHAHSTKLHSRSMQKPSTKVCLSIDIRGSMVWGAYCTFLYSNCYILLHKIDGKVNGKVRWLGNSKEWVRLTVWQVLMYRAVHVLQYESISCIRSVFNCNFSFIAYHRMYIAHFQSGCIWYCIPGLV